MTALSGRVDGVGAEILKAQLADNHGAFCIAGMTETSAREARIRVLAALNAAGVKVEGTVQIDGADRGGGHDLAIAVAAVEIDAPLTMLVGELSLCGDVLRVRGIIPILLAAVRYGATQAIVSDLTDRRELRVVREACSLDVRVAHTLTDVIEHLRGERECPRALDPARSNSNDLGPVPGSLASVAAAVQEAPGGVLLMGPPGSGKTMVARRVTLASVDVERALEIHTIYSAVGMVWDRERLPFRAPHHTASEVALVGGGDPVRPGDVTLAHNGILFLDELPEFRRGAIDALGSVLRAGVVTLRRTQYRMGAGDRIVTMPARPAKVIAAANPCPCGYAGTSPRIRRPCRCRPEQIEAWNERLASMAAVLGLTTTIRMPEEAGR